MARLLFGWIAASLLVPLSLQAATIVVNSKADVIADDGLCTLREAVIAANTNTASGSTPGECAAGEPTDPITDLPIDHIIFENLPGSPDRYTLTRLFVPPDGGAATTPSTAIWTSGRA